MSDPPIADDDEEPDEDPVEAWDGRAESGSFGDWQARAGHLILTAARLLAGEVGPVTGDWCAMTPREQARAGGWARGAIEWHSAGRGG